jgi:hypothetical protein
MELEETAQVNDETGVGDTSQMHGRKEHLDEQAAAQRDDDSDRDERG